MFHNLPSLFAAFSLFLIKVWMMTTPRDMPQLGWEVREHATSFLCSFYLFTMTIMKGLKISHMPYPSYTPGQAVLTVGAFQLEV